MKPTALDALRVDRAIETARDDVERLCRRRFYNVITTYRWDWPNNQLAAPWRIWFDQVELADVTTTVPVVTSGGHVITAANIFWGPWNYSPPYSYIELNRATTAAFGVSTTPQQDVSILGNWGYWTQVTSAGSLAAAITDTSGTSVTVTSGNSPGVGDVMIVDSESMLVRDRAFTSTGQTQVSGAATDKASDVSLTVSGGTYSAGEVLLLDSEQMLVISAAGSVVTVKRAWNGTVLATHSGATIYAARLLTVSRGFGGTTAATHSNAAAVNISVIPAGVKALAVAEAVNTIQQETSGYSHQIGETGATMTITGGQLDDLRDRVYRQFGRKGRIRVI